MIELENNLYNNELDRKEMDKWFDYIANVLTKEYPPNYEEYIKEDRLYHKECENLKIIDTVEFNCTTYKQMRFRHNYKLDTYHIGNKYLKNVRFSSYKNIKSIELEIGGQPIDRIHDNDDISYLLKLLRKIYKVTSKTILPIHALLIPLYIAYYHHIRIKVEFTKLTDELVVTGDIYQNDEGKLTHYDGYHWIIYPMSWIINKVYRYGREYVNLDNQIVKIGLNFCHVIKYLYIISNNAEVKTCKISINGINILKINNLYRDKDIGYYIIPFTKGNDITKYSLNLFVMNTLVLHLQFDNVLDNAYYDVVLVGSVPIRSMSGMTGLALCLLP